jgi:single-strand DNA-binding protein
LNKITLIGSLVRDPEMRSTPNGVSVCTFTIAVNNRFKDATGENKAQFFKISAWRGLSETCGRYLSKGKKCAVIGELTGSQYTARDGTTRMSLDVKADEVEFLSPKQSAEQHEEPSADTADSQGFTDIATDDIPF